MAYSSTLRILRGIPSELLRHLFGRALASLFRSYDRYLQRRHLDEMDEHMLADLGLTRADVERECGKPFWP